MRKIEASMICAVQHFASGGMARDNWRSGNTEVINCFIGIRGTAGYIHTVEVYLHSNLICTIYPNSRQMNLFDAGWESVTTKSRLNALCRAFTDRSGIYQKQHKWFVDGTIHGNSDQDWEGHCMVPFSIDWNRWQLPTARKVAEQSMPAFC
jgi:hypothetical protein